MRILWEKPLDGWVKVNTDGAVRGDGHTTTVGVIRNNFGEWRCGFVTNNDIFIVSKAKLWGVEQGLMLAWDDGFKKVILEMDPYLVTTMLGNELPQGHPLASLVNKCQGLLKRDWSIQFRYVFRKANCAVNHLARLTYTYNFGLSILFDPSECVFIYFAQ